LDQPDKKKPGKGLEGEAGTRILMCFILSSDVAYIKIREATALSSQIYTDRLENLKDEI
jgi:hypothetical protein